MGTPTCNTSHSSLKASFSALTYTGLSFPPGLIPPKELVYYFLLVSPSASRCHLSTRQPSPSLLNSYHLAPSWCYSYRIQQLYLQPPPGLVFSSFLFSSLVLLLSSPSLKSNQTSLSSMSSSACAFSPLHARGSCDIILIPSP